MKRFTDNFIGMGFSSVNHDIGGTCNKRLTYKKIVRLNLKQSIFIMRIKIYVCINITKNTIYRRIRTYFK